MVAVSGQSLASLFIQKSYQFMPFLCVLMKKTPHWTNSMVPCTLRGTLSGSVYEAFSISPCTFWMFISQSVGLYREAGEPFGGDQADRSRSLRVRSESHSWVTLFPGLSWCGQLWRHGLTTTDWKDPLRFPYYDRLKAHITVCQDKPFLLYVNLLGTGTGIEKEQIHAPFNSLLW